MIVHIKRIAAAAGPGSAKSSARMLTMLHHTHRPTTAARGYLAPLYRDQMPAIHNICSAVHFNVELWTQTHCLLSSQFSASWVICGLKGGQMSGWSHVLHSPSTSWNPQPYDPLWPVNHLPAYTRMSIVATLYDSSRWTVLSFSDMGGRCGASQ